MLGDIGLWIDALGGLAQVAAGIYALSRRAFSFALFFGLNGLAFLLRNLVPHEHRLFPLLGGSVWGALNWIALLFVVVLTLGWPRAAATRAVGAVIAILLAALAWKAAPASVNLLVFGGLAIYAGTALLLVVLARHGANAPRHRDAALLTAAVAINSALHAGVGVAAAATMYYAAHTVVLGAIAALWIVCALRHGEKSASLAAAVLIVGVALGALLAVALHTQKAVQDSGAYGSGRVIASAIACYALRRGAVI